MSTEAFRAFYEKRHKELRSKGVHGSIGTYHIYDEEGNLVTKNAEGAIQETLVIPSYRPPSLEELSIMEHERKERIALATKVYDEAFHVLHQEYQRKNRSVQTILAHQRRVVEADHQLQHARFPLRYIARLSGVETRKVLFDEPNEIRKLPYSVAALKVSPFPLQELYVREGPSPASPPSSLTPFRSDKPVFLIQDIDTNEYGFLSLDWPVQIRLASVTYHSAKQALAAELAKTFHDDEEFRKILDAETPAEVSYSMEDAKEATPDLWANATKKHLYTIQEAKFRQYPELTSRLLATGDAVLAVYLPRDELLGIGIAADDPRAKNPLYWRGQNLLGTILMEIRGKLKEEMVAAPVSAPPKKRFSIKRPIRASSASSASSASASLPFVVTNHLSGHETSVPGLYYIPNALTPEQESALLAFLDGPNATWVSVTESAQSRRVQHYGYQYDYKRRTVSGSTHPIPEGWQSILGVGYPWNQVIVNEYFPGQGISTHTDAPVYGDTIICYTLGSGATMRFTNPTTGETIDIYVAPRSVYVMSGDSRYQWKHEMIGRKSNVVDGTRIQRSRRISITLRWVPETSVPAAPAPAAPAVPVSVAVPAAPAPAPVQ